MIEPNDAATANMHDEGATIRRRTMLAGAAWAVPAVALTAASPAFAASGTRVTITQAPAETPSCQGTKSSLVAHVDASQNVGQVVQFSLPSGWRWATGSGSYLTDSSGNATVPAGDIVVGKTVGTVTATISGVTAAVDLDVAGVGALATDSSSVPFPSGANSQILRVRANMSGVVVVRTNGDIWSWYDNSTTTDESWLQVGTGASTAPQAATYVWGQNTRAALWVKSGALQLGSSAVTFPSGGNSGFARVASCNSIAMAVKTNGEVWCWQEGGSWSQLDTGVADDLDQIAPVWDARSGNMFYWLKNGVIYSSAGGAITMGSGQNSGVARLSVAWMRDGYDTNLVAVKANGDAWVYARSQGWRSSATGAATGGEQSCPADTGSGGGTALVIRSGQLAKYGSAGNVGMASGESNSDFYRVATTWQYNVAVKRDGTMFGTYPVSGNNRSFTKIASGTATGATQRGVSVAAAPGGGNRRRGFWITTASC